MRARLNTLSDVVAWRLCLGCGACAWACPEQKVRLFDFEDEGIRPVVEGGPCKSCGECLAVCPAVESDFYHGSNGFLENAASQRFQSDWGPITGMWEGHAADAEIRFKGSSGGALTALAAYCLEGLGMHGVLHIAQDPADPIRNRTRLSRTRAELLAATGSRYSPASVCDGLGLVESAPGPCVIIGKPSEIAAVRNARRLRPGLDAKVGVTFSFFCAETPSTRGTIALLQKLGIRPGAVAALRYRGLGWPGHFAPTLRGHASPACKVTYRESWAFLQAYRPWSVQLWPDGTGELADISCGDPWYIEPDERSPGSSLVVARTPRGREIVEAAAAAGYLELQPAESWKLAKSQRGLLLKKGSVWGRRVALRMLGLPVTRFPGLELSRCWWALPMGAKLRSTLGTVRRVLQRRLYRRFRLDLRQARPTGAPLAETQECSPPGSLAGRRERPLETRRMGAECGVASSAI